MPNTVPVNTWVEPQLSERLDKARKTFYHSRSQAVREGIALYCEKIERKLNKKKGAKRG